MPNMRIVLLTLVSLIAAVMAVNALLWLLVPATAAELLKMPLLSGEALSSQMDIGAFFLGVASFMVLGLVTRRPEWLRAAAILFFGAAVYRTVSWLIHGAALLPDMIIPELLMGSLLVIASRVLARPSATH